MAVTVRRESLCADRAVVDRQFEGGNRQQVRFVEQTAGDCAVSDVVVRDSLNHNELTMGLGTNTTYCVSVANPLMSYAPPAVCATHRMQFFFSLAGKISASGSSAPVAGVRLDYVVGGVVSGHVTTDLTGAFLITVQSAAIDATPNAPTSEIVITPSLVLNGFPHRFTCTGQYGCTALNTSVAEGERSYSVRRVVRHAMTVEGARFIDESSFVVTGIVTLPATCDPLGGACYTAQGGLQGTPCALPSVQICAYKSYTQTRLGECVSSAAGTGRYQIPVQVGSDVDLRATFTAGPNVTAIVKPAIAPNPHHSSIETGSPVYTGFYRFTNIADHKNGTHTR